ncbi:MAG: phage holin family protein [Bacteroidales bacterium]|jgi:fatty acid desaturase
MKDIEDKADLLETLLDRATEYGKTSIELVKLKALDKTTDIVSSFVPLCVVILLVASFLLFLNLGLALWLGEILGKPFYGFFVVAGFYVFMGIVIHFFLRKWIKKLVGNYFIKHVLK